MGLTARTIFLLANALLLAHAEEDRVNRTPHVGSLLETIGYKEFINAEKGQLRITIWEQTNPGAKESEIMCGIKTDVAGNYTLRFLRPDQTVDEVTAVIVRTSEQPFNEPIRTQFPIALSHLRPSTAFVSLVEGSSLERQEVGKLEVAARVPLQGHERRAAKRSGKSSKRRKNEQSKKSRIVAAKGRGERVVGSKDAAKRSKNVEKAKNKKKERKQERVGRKEK